MAKTVVGVGDPKAIKRYSAFLAVDIARESYWNRKFMGTGETAQAPIQILPHLENDAGDQISYDLVMQLRMKPIEGDAILRGKEEKLDFFSDSLYIDQLRGGVNTGGRMTRKRTIHNMRAVARVRQSEWWSRILDENIFMYASGARGVNDDFVYDSAYTGFAGNAFVAPDTKHLIYGTGATAKNNLTSSHKMDLGILERAKTKSTTLGGGTTRIPKIEPIKINGEGIGVAVIHPFQTYDLRTNSSTGQWMDIQKAAAAAEGRNNPMFQGSLGMYAGIVLHEHQAVIGFNDYGAGANVTARRGLFLGRQALVVAFGSEGGQGMARFSWNEEMEDRGNQVVITTSSILGMKKTAFTIDGTSYDFGIISMDTYATDPNP